MSDVVTAEECPPRSIAAITAFGDVQDLHAALAAEFGVALPATPGFVQAGSITLSCLAPKRFLAAAPRDANLAARLAKNLEGIAAVTYQSDLWFYVALSGPASREKLAHVVPVDLAPEKFPVGAFALTRAGHFDARLWHISEQRYQVAVARSYAQDLRHLLV